MFDIENNLVLKIVLSIVFITFILCIVLICITFKIIYDRKISVNQTNQPELIIQDGFMQPSEVTAIQTPQILIPPKIIDPIKEYDYHKLSDPLETPTTRTDRYLLGPLELRGMFNYPVRGYPDNPRWLGILISDDDHSLCTDGKCLHDKDNKILKLFGRQQYPGSNQYDYYTMLNIGHDQVKVRLHHKKELYDDDDVHVHELGRKYKVQLNKNDDLIYNPYF